MYKQAIKIVCAGRTDTGVHALGQVFHFCAFPVIPCNRILSVVNRRLPSDIVIRHIDIVDLAFHARFSAKERVYCYRLFVSSDTDPFLERYALRIRAPLDRAKINQFCSIMEGCHDFATFAKCGSSVKSTEREIFSMQCNDFHFVSMVSDYFGYEISIRANGFLYGMVRSIISTALLFADNRFCANEVSNMLLYNCRNRLGKPVSACGLYLVEVRY